MGWRTRLCEASTVVRKHFSCEIFWCPNARECGKPFLTLFLRSYCALLIRTRITSCLKSYWWTYKHRKTLHMTVNFTRIPTLNFQLSFVSQKTWRLACFLLIINPWRLWDAAKRTKALAWHSDRMPHQWLPTVARQKLPYDWTGLRLLQGILGVPTFH